VADQDLTGETIAFGARKLNPDDDPKYLNTPETQIFKKSQVLYGADLAKREIPKRRQAVIVEGYTDRDGLPPVRGAEAVGRRPYLVRRGST